MYTEEFTLPIDGEEIYGVVDAPDATTLPSFLFLHGAGTATSDRAKYLSDHLLTKNKATIRFDFSGHGKSSGIIAEASLLRRLAQSTAIAKHFNIDNHPDLTVIATSMSGHVAARLSRIIPIKHLVLFCPAAYGALAETVPFDERFSDILRQPNSFAASPAFDDISAFTGDITLIIGSDDAIIPADVVSGYLQHATKAKSFTHHIIPGAPHLLHGWLQNQPEELGKVLALLQR